MVYRYAPSSFGSRAYEQNTHVARRMQTLVGLMCWFDANVTRSPCLARFTASASVPSPIRSPVRKSATPSAGASRSPAMTLSAIGISAGSAMRERSNTTAEGKALLLESPGDEGHVVAAESRAVAERRADFTGLRLVRREVQIAARGIGVAVVDRRRHDLITDRQQRGDHLHRTGRTEHVPGHRLGGRHAELVHGVTEHPGDRGRLVGIVE